jgi:acetyl-CoA carboxylase carboxyl transferase subunit beta
MPDGPRWFEQAPPQPTPLRSRARPDLPDDLWIKCPSAGPSTTRTTSPARCRSARSAAPSQDRLARALDLVVDPESFVELDGKLAPMDPLGFVDSKPYHERLAATQRKIGRKDAYIGGRASIEGIPVQIGTFEFAFLGGSMGSVVGEAITRQLRARDRGAEAAVIISASGGARMQGGVLSLMRCEDLRRARSTPGRGEEAVHQRAHAPDHGRVAASFAMLGDVILAEPNALIGFAGPRVIEQTIGPVAAARLPDERVPARARPGRPHRAAQGPAGPRSRRACACWRIASAPEGPDRGY